MAGEQHAAAPGSTRLRASTPAAKSQGLNFSAGQMDSFLVFANLSCFLVLFSYFFISAEGLSSLHCEVNFIWVVAWGFAVCRPRRTILYHTPHLSHLEGLGL